jgi:hypothetical protein
MEKPGQWDDIQKERKINHLNKQQHEWFLTQLCWAKPAIQNIWFCLHKTLENSVYSLVTEGRSVVA